MICPASEISPERIRFGGVISDKAHVLYYSGDPCVRRFG
jgi:hypothetical protein